MASAPLADEFTVVDAADTGGPSRFELHQNGELRSWATYRRQGNAFVVPHVETLIEHRGQGLADRLMEGMIGLARDAGAVIVPYCSFAADFFRAHPEHDDVLGSAGR